MVFTMLFHVEPPSVENSQLITLPVCPDKVNVPEFEPSHTNAFDATVPPTEIGSTVIVAGVEFVAAQVPFCTRARYIVVTSKFKYACEVVMFAMLFQVNPPSMENCHMVTAPVCPERVSTPAFPLAHTVASAATLPPTEGASTVMVAGAEFAEGHNPLCTCARNMVVTIRLL